MIEPAEIKDFTVTVWQYYDQYARQELPWRQPEADGSFNAYKIMVSEIMLQQTQVNRVIDKYQQFLAVFPNVQALAAAPQAEVLLAWSGLGYNRRARFVQQAAQQIIAQAPDPQHVTFPSEIAELVKLPGVGINTAAAIRAYAFNLPALFIETNIRSVYIHHFFHDDSDVTDAQLRTVIEQTLPKVDFRTWYWALMDYGTHLKATVGNRSRQSRHYTRQSPFAGSQRQVRGQVLRALASGQQSYEQLATSIPDTRLAAVLDDLRSEKLIGFDHNQYHL